jgi:hypothetical protein
LSLGFGQRRGRVQCCSRLPRTGALSGAHTEDMSRSVRLEDMCVRRRTSCDRVHRWLFFPILSEPCAVPESRSVDIFLGQNF